MQRFLDFILILIVMIFLSLHMAHAAPKAEQAFSMTIDEAISTALARNPAIAAARASVSEADCMSPTPSRNHCTAAPAINIDPSRA